MLLAMIIINGTTITNTSSIWNVLGEANTVTHPSRSHFRPISADAVARSAASKNHKKGYDKC